VIYRQLQREAASLAFNDAFFIQTWLFLALLGLLWILRKPPMGPRTSPMGHWAALGREASIKGDLKNRSTKHEILNNTEWPKFEW
jgi:hypothetical protein